MYLHNLINAYIYITMKGAQLNSNSYIWRHTLLNFEVLLLYCLLATHAGILRTSDHSINPAEKCAQTLKEMHFKRCSSRDALHELLFTRCSSRVAFSEMLFTRLSSRDALHDILFTSCSLRDAFHEMLLTRYLITR